MSAPTSPVVDEWIPAITLWQPWASLIFAGVKLHETRSFRYPARLEGRVVAIHSAAKFPAAKHISEALNDLCYDTWGCGYNYSLPFGAILGTVRLSGCSSTDLSAGFQAEDELIAGNWSAGRFAWALDDVTPLGAPIPAKGKQGWWNIPASLVIS